MPKMSRTEMKLKAQEEIMNSLGSLLGYAQEAMESRGEWVGGENADAFAEILQREADRVAKLMGYEEAWSN
jgi:hypothetical protein